MNFGKIHASGISQILLKGQQSKINPNLKRISVLDKWRWDGELALYLDATCILMAGDGSAAKRDETNQTVTRCPCFNDICPCQ